MIVNVNDVLAVLVVVVESCPVMVTVYVPLGGFLARLIVLLLHADIANPAAASTSTHAAERNRFA